MWNHAITAVFWVWQIVALHQFTSWCESIRLPLGFNVTYCCAVYIYIWHEIWRFPKCFECNNSLHVFYSSWREIWRFPQCFECNKLLCSIHYGVNSCGSSSVWSATNSCALLIMVWIHAVHAVVLWTCWQIVVPQGFLSARVSPLWSKLLAHNYRFKEDGWFCLWFIEPQTTGLVFKQMQRAVLQLEEH